MDNLKLLQRIHIVVIFFMIVATCVTFYHLLRQPPITSTQAEHTAQTATFEITEGMNQDGMPATSSADTLWLGTGNSLETSYAAMRFVGTALPYQARVQSATLVVTSSEDSSLGVNVDISGEMGDTALSQGSVATRVTTETERAWDTHLPWVKNTSYMIDVTNPVSEMVEKTQERSSLTLLIHGRGGVNGKRLIYATGPSAPTLQIRFVTE